MEPQRLVDHVAMRLASCFPLFSAPNCGYRIDSVIKSVACSGIIADTPCCTVARYSQTSAGIWHRAQPPQRPCEHGGARASQIPSCVAPSTNQESALDDAEEAPPPGVEHINVAAAWRNEEAAFWVLFLAVLGPFFSRFHPTLQTIFTPFLVVQFQSVPLQILAIWGAFQVMFRCLL